MAQTAAKAASGFSKLTSVVTNVGSAFLTASAAMAAMLVIEEIIKLIYNAVTAQQRAIEAGK